MKNMRISLPEDKRKKAADALNSVLLDLIDLSMQTLQVHWAVIGANFKTVHEHMDELLDAYREQIDEIGERILVLGFVPNGQAHVVAKNAQLDPIPDGFHQADALVPMLADRVAAVAQRTRAQQEALGDVDAPSEDLLIGLIEQLEKQLWMLQATES